ncbi:MAG: hypothetical protein QXW10_01775 [Candidatus Micrarchaeaceae archaeon]
MIGKEGKDKSSVTLTNAWSILEERRKMREATYEQQLALEHASKFKVEDSVSERQRKALDGLNILKPDTVTKLIDMQPGNEMLVRQVISMEKKAFEPEDVAKILAVFKKGKN